MPNIHLINPDFVDKTKCGLDVIDVIQDKQAGTSWRPTQITCPNCRAANEAQPTYRAVFEFPNENARDCFFAWFFDGGGESRFLDGEETAALDNGRKPIVSFNIDKGPDLEKVSCAHE